MKLLRRAMKGSIKFSLFVTGGASDPRDLLAEFSCDSVADQLLQLVLTVHATSASGVQSFPVVNRLKTNSRNRTDQGRLSSLAGIANETKRELI